MSARRLLRLIHGWLGAVAALFVILVGGSGALLAFMPELFVAEYGAMLRAPAPSPGARAADLDRIIAAARAGTREPIEMIGVLMPDSRVPGLEVAMAFGVPKDGGEDQVTMLAVDPWSATYQGQFRLHDAFAHQTIDFHHMLLAGEIGGLLVSVLGLLLLAFVLTGLWLWWPRDGGLWRKARRLDLRGGPRRALFALHGWSGVWAALLILFFSVTGTATAQPGWFGLPALDETPPAVFARQCSGTVSPGEAARAAQASVPGARLASVGLPGGARAPYRFGFKRGGDLDRIDGDLIVLAHASCTGVVQTIDTAARPAAEQAGKMMLSLHGGYSFGGLLGDLLVIVTGLMLVLSSLSGIYVFVTRTLKRRVARAAAPQPLPADDVVLRARRGCPNASPEGDGLKWMNGSG